MSAIRLEGCEQHNLKGIDVEIPLGRLTVVTGVSGSGKSSLAFDTLFAEGQRRYVETFSAYARQFLDRMERPRVERVTGIPPAVAIEQGNRVRSSRSTVATVTELHDYVKVLFARLGTRHCDRCDRPVSKLTPAEITEEWMARGGHALVGWEVDAAEPDVLAKSLLAQGVRRVYESGKVSNLERGEARVGTWVALLDRIALEPRRRSRLLDAIEQSFAHGKGQIAIVDDLGKVHRYGAELKCIPCGISYGAPDPASLSFNDAQGACEACRGFGRVIAIDPDLVVPDPRKTLAEGAFKIWTTPKTEWERDALHAFCRRTGIPLDRPYEKLSKKHRKMLWEGEPGGYEDGKWFGVEGWFQWLEGRVYRMHVRVLLSRYRTYQTCVACGGSRLKEQALRVRLGGKTIADATALTIEDARAFFEKVEIDEHLEHSLRPVHEEITSRLRYLDEVGLSYLRLDRQSRTLSGGEMQRVNLTAAVGSRLVGTLFVLDEPSVGLHPRDNDRLLSILRRLVDQGNTAVVVEHEEAVLRTADHVIDLGPGAGEQGGTIVAQGTLADLLASERSVTGRILREGVRLEPSPVTGDAFEHGVLELKGVTAHNLKDVDVRFPLRRLTCLSGVSGSGKSTLLETVLYRNLLRRRGEPVAEPGAVRSIAGDEEFTEIVYVDANSPQRGGKSLIATALKIWDDVRTLFGACEQSRARGFTKATFSFNTPGGRCEVCEGAGFERVEMQFLADVETVCAECEGERFQDDVLAVRVEGLSIADVLRLTIAEAPEWLVERVPKAASRLLPAVQTGLSYLRLGQGISTLSGGESQRLKIAIALGRKRGRERALYLLDEPTTGLHGADIEDLHRALRLLTERGDTVIAIEHHLDLIAASDWVIDLGPEGGERGGEIVACGTPATIARDERSLTGRFLAREGRRGELVAEAARRPATPVETGAEAITLSGVRENNLQDLHVKVPRGRFVVVTGVSGSGKSSLAFDVLFHEGQRRYLDTLSPYARQFIREVDRPEVDRIDGLPAAIAIEQRTSRSGPNSTVATITEIWHALRLLYTRAGVQDCPRCGQEVQPISQERIHAEVRKALATSVGKRSRTLLLAPLIRGRKGFHREVFEGLGKVGFETARVDGKILPIDPVPPLDRYAEHDVDVVVAELRDEVSREVVERALDIGEGTLYLLRGSQQDTYSTRRFCARCGIGFPDPDPRQFSFNSRHGRCEACRGRGSREAFVEALVVEHPERSLEDGAIPLLARPPFGKRGVQAFARQVESVLGIPSDRPWRRLGERQRERILFGADDFEGLFPRLENALQEAGGKPLEAYRQELPCAACFGTRLKEASRFVRVLDRRIGEVSRLTIGEARTWIEGLRAEGKEGVVLAELEREVLPRLRFLEEVGLEYLRLDRPGPTLSGGEAQRIRVAASLGSSLCGALYVLDEPTIGLHPHDHQRLMQALLELRDLGNSVVVVEHDEDTIQRADHVIELGPGAGKWGGRIVVQGTIDDLRAHASSKTGRSLRGEGRGRSNARGVPAVEEWIRLRGAHRHNLRSIDLDLPVGALTVVTGVSGSGKSTLVHDVLFASLHGQRPVGCRSIETPYPFDRILEVDQTPIGRTPRSVPATYVGIFDAIRQVFAATVVARERGYAPNRFSFNVRGGRCEVCEGQGTLKMEMSFLPDARVPCPSCHGRRFHGETLEVTYAGLSIADVLELTIEQALAVFENHPQIEPALRLLCDVGLGYLQLGQQSPTLSGGEAQRVKLIEELRKRSRGRTLYLLDEPTTGLSLTDVRLLIDVLHRLVERGDTLIVIEHDLDLIAEADYLIDLGPGGGDAGGEIVAQGFTEALLNGKDVPRSRTLEVLHAWWRRFGRQEGAPS